MEVKLEMVTTTHMCTVDLCGQSINESRIFSGVLEAEPTCIEKEFLVVRTPSVVVLQVIGLIIKQATALQRLLKVLERSLLHARLQKLGSDHPLEVKF